MKILTRNFTHTFRRFLTVNVMNLLGLSVAFTAFFIIMTQVDYDYNFNKGYKDYQQLYRLEIRQDTLIHDWQVWIPRPLGEMIDSCSPHVLAGSIVNAGSTDMDVFVDDKKYKEKMLQGIGNFIQVFQPDMQTGTADALKNPNTVLVPESMALRLFGNTNAMGKTLFLNKKASQPYTVGGVYRDFPQNTQIPNALLVAYEDAYSKDDWTNWGLVYYLRTEDKQYAADIAAMVTKKILSQYEEEGNNGFGLRFTPLTETHFSAVSGNTSTRTTMYLLLCTSFLIVFIAGVNFMNFSLAETPMRIKSINTQKVLGASTGTLRGGLMAESVLISVMAFGLSLFWLHLLQRSFMQELVEADLQLGQHLGLLGFTLLMALALGVMVSLYPSYYVTSFPPALVLKGSFGLSPRGKLLRTVLVCCQFVVTFVLICFVGVMYLQSHFIRTTDYGYDKEQILVGNVNADADKQSDAILNEVCSVPGVEGAAFSDFVLSSGDGYMGWNRAEGERQMQFSCMPVDYRYLKVLGIKITEGRNFGNADGDVYIFNEAARKKFDWLKVDQKIFANDYPVVGFCENVKYTSFRTDSSTQPMAFFVMGKEHKGWWWRNILNVRVAAGTDKVEMCKTLQRRMEKFLPDFDCDFRFMDEVLNRTYQREQRFTKQILLFSVLTILISIIGVLGLTMFESEYRRKEIGIRKVMGSSTREILLMFNRRYIRILLGCFAVAAPVAWWISADWLKGFAQRTAVAWWIFVLALGVVAGVTLLVVTYQSWKTANANPVESLKTE